MVTESQRRAVRLCETWLRVRFTGHIDSPDEVRAFLYTYFDKAKEAKNAALDLCGGCRIE